MKSHFENIKFLYGDANVRLPNSIFRDLSSTIKSKNGSTNIQQVAFSYAYLTAVAFLYKYAHFVDIENNTYIQNSDIKEILGYSRTTKSIDKIIKKDGILDKMSLTLTTKEYPVSFILNRNEKINGIFVREFETIKDLDVDNINYTTIKNIVKNRNYEVKEPLFLTTGYKNREYGTLYSIENTHKINIYEFLKLIFDSSLDNIDFLLYGFFKSKCKGNKDNMKSIAVNRIVSEIGIDRGTFYKHLEKLKNKGYIYVNHKEWIMTDDIYKDYIKANDYFWRGA